jgi:hypothetical protein
MIAIEASRHLPPTRSRRVSVPILFQNEILCVMEDPQSLQYQIRAIDIDSGRERLTDLPVGLPWYGWLTDGRLLWIASADRVVVFDGKTRTNYRPRRKLTGHTCKIFLYEGTPAIIENDGLYRLLVFTNGEWEVRGELTLPGTGRSWAKSEIDSEEHLVSLAENPRTNAKNDSEFVSVTSVDDRIHLIHFGSESGVIAYREGLEFVTRDPDMVSAVFPENVPPDVTGWKKLPFKVWNGFSSCSSQDGPLLAIQSAPEDPMRIWTWAPVTSQNPFHIFKEIQGDFSGYLQLASSPDGREVYTFHNQGLFLLGPRVQRYANGEWQNFPLKIDSALAQIIRWTVQARWGLTPGKWLMGLRTVRTSLRPCGFARSLLRELFMAFDAPLLLTPFPGITSMLSTDCRQRLGDLAADTIVVQRI